MTFDERLINLAIGLGWLAVFLLGIVVLERALGLAVDLFWQLTLDLTEEFIP